MNRSFLILGWSAIAAYILANQFEMTTGERGSYEILHSLTGIAWYCHIDDCRLVFGGLTGPYTLAIMLIGLALYGLLTASKLGVSDAKSDRMAFIDSQISNMRQSGESTQTLSDRLISAGHSKAEIDECIARRKRHI